MAAAAGVPGWVWCVDLGLALFSPFHFAPISSFGFDGGFGREEGGGRKAAGRWIRLEISESRCGVWHRVWTAVETSGAQDAGFSLVLFYSFF